MKKIFLTSALALATLMSMAGDNQNEMIRKVINRKIIFPDKMELTEKTTVEIQFEIMPDGCLALTASNGDASLVNYIAERISNVKLAYDPAGKNVYVYKFTFEKEESTKK